MTTVVFQSYRTRDVPPWIERCLASARGWAEARGFAYRFLDDRFFERAPAWYRERAGHHPLPVSDLARLNVARELLDEGWERTVWVDADVLVFDPARFDVDVASPFAFSPEFWVRPALPRPWRPLAGPVAVGRRVNNSVTVFGRGSEEELERFVARTEAAVRDQTGEVHPVSAGTRWLTRLHRKEGLPLLAHNGTFSPRTLRDLVEGGSWALRALARAHGVRLGAANLCGGLVGDGGWSPRPVPPTWLERAVDVLLETSGDVVNRFVPGRDPLSSPP